jgi:hypothetical protein
MAFLPASLALLTDVEHQATIQSDLRNLTNRLIETIIAFNRTKNQQNGVIESLPRDPTDVDHNLSMLRAYAPAEFHLPVHQLLCAHAALIVSDPLHLLAMWGPHLPKKPTPVKDLPSLRWPPYDEDRAKIQSIFGVDPLPIAPLAAAVDGRIGNMMEDRGKVDSDLITDPTLYPSPLGPGIKFSNLFAELSRAVSDNKDVRRQAAANLSKYMNQIIYLHRTKAPHKARAVAKGSPPPSTSSPRAAASKEPPKAPSKAKGMPKPTTTDAHKALAKKISNILGKIADSTICKRFPVICTHVAAMARSHEIGLTKAGKPRMSPDIMDAALHILLERAQKARVRRSIDVAKAFTTSYQAAPTVKTNAEAKLRVFIDLA